MQAEEHTEKKHKKFKQYFRKGWHADSITISEPNYKLQLTELEEVTSQLKGQLFISQNEGDKPGLFINVIAKVRFPHLISIILPGNKIASIDSVGLFDMPLLQYLGLNDNYIMSIKPLRKGNWPNLLFLNLKQNKINDFRCLSELKMSNKFQSLTIAVSKQRDRTITGGVEWLAKLQPNNIQNINYFFHPFRQWWSQQRLEFRIDNQFQTLAKKFVLGDRVFINSNCFD